MKTEKMSGFANLSIIYRRLKRIFFDSYKLKRRLGIRNMPLMNGKGLKSEFFNEKAAIFPDRYLELFSIGEWKIAQKPLRDIDYAFSSSTDMKTTGSFSLHPYENIRMLISNSNFIRNHKINISTISYVFVRNKVKRWELT